jgi:hypothetical protein
MNEIGPARPVLPRAAPLLAIGVVLVLAGGVAIGWHLWHSGPAPHPVSGPAETILPPAVPGSAVAGSAAGAPSIPLPTGPSPSAPFHAASSSPPVQAEPTLPAAPAPTSSASSAVEPVATPAAPLPIAPSPATRMPSPATSRPVPAQAALRASNPAASAHRQAQTRAPLSAPLPRHKPKPPPERWIVQFGIFRSDDHAKLLVDTLTFDRVASRIVTERDQQGVTRYLVQSPAYKSKTIAQAAAKRASARGASHGAVVERQ